MELSTVPLADLRLSEINPREHNDANLAAIRGSLEHHGQVLPLLVRRETSEVIGGNGRLVVMRDMGWESAEVVYVDNLTHDQALSLGLALNKTSDLAGWHLGELGDVLRGLASTGVDVEAMTGFGTPEIAALIDGAGSGFTIDREPPPPVDALPEGSSASGCRPIAVTPDMRETIDQAVHVLREREDDASITEGRCVELMAAEFLSGN